MSQNILKIALYIALCGYNNQEMTTLKHLRGCDSCYRYKQLWNDRRECEKCSHISVMAMKDVEELRDGAPLNRKPFE